MHKQMRKRRRRSAITNARPSPGYSPPAFHRPKASRNGKSTRALPSLIASNLYLLCKIMRQRKVAVVGYKGAADDEYRIVRRRNLLHPARYLPFPTWSGDEIVARLCACGAFTNVGENSVVRSSELHAVVATRHL